MTEFLTDFHNHHFLSLVRVTNGLKKLHLDLPMVHEDLGTMVSLSSIVGDIFWPHLADVELCYFTTTDHDLRRFLVRHKDTLTKVLFSEVNRNVSPHLRESYQRSRCSSYEVTSHASSIAFTSSETLATQAESMARKSPNSSSPEGLCFRQDRSYVPE
jgi:hypothetical protein